MKLFIYIPADRLEQQLVIDIPKKLEQHFQADMLEQLVNSLYKLFGVEPQESEEEE